MITTKQYQKLLRQNEKLKKQNKELKDVLKDMIDRGNYYRKCYKQMRNDFYKNRNQITYLTDKLKQIRSLTFNL